MKKFFMAVSLLVMSAGFASAGPVVIDGTDSADHGYVSGGVNYSGWEYMQRALQNLAPAVGNGNKKIVTLGTTSGGSARTAIDSAFTLSTLPGLGWSITHIDGTAAITNYFAGIGSTTLANTGILYIPTVGNVGGDMDTAELAVLNSNASAIDSYVSGAGTPLLGGGLFSQGESPGTAGAYGWLSTLIPGIVVTDIGAGGVGTAITLTAAGTAAFPGLTTADLTGAVPWHNYFSGSLGGLSVLGTTTYSGSKNIILGGGAGTSISHPCGTPGGSPCSSVPESSSMILLGTGLLILGWTKRKISSES